jgi:hypothetical protein
MFRLKKMKFSLLLLLVELILIETRLLSNNRQKPIKKISKVYKWNGKTIQGQARSKSTV